MKLWRKMATFRVKPDDEDLKSAGYKCLGECDEKGNLLKAPKKKRSKKIKSEVIEEDGIIKDGIIEDGIEGLD